MHKAQLQNPAAINNEYVENENYEGINGLEYILEYIEQDSETMKRRVVIHGQEDHSTMDDPIQALHQNLSHSPDILFLCCGCQNRIVEYYRSGCIKTLC